MPTIEQLESLLEKDPDDAFLNFGLAMAFVSEKRSAEAHRQFLRTLEVNADYVPAYFQKGQLFARDGDDDAAIDILKQGIEVAQRTGDAHAEGEMREFLEGLEI